MTFPLYIEVDEIYNLACPASPVHYKHDPVQTTKTSVHGAINLLGLAKRLGARIFQASTSEVYGDPVVHPQTEDYWGNVNPIGDRSCYDEGKRCAETLFFDYFRQHRLDIKVARIFNTYGPHMHPNDGRVVSNFIMQALRGEDITVYGEGNQTRSFCYVDDLIEAFVRFMATEPGVTGPMNLGNPGEFTILQLAEEVLRQTGSRSKIVFKPLPNDDPRQRKPDIGLAKSTLGWEPKVELRQGLEKTIRYFLHLPKRDRVGPDCPATSMRPSSPKEYGTGTESISPSFARSDAGGYQVSMNHRELALTSMVASPSDRNVAEGRRVLLAEAEALAAAAEALGEDFDRAVELLAETKGRIIATGMGKSGIMGRKIAATFASTGAPALFVHPAEASHGDLGMIGRQDIVLAISNSGETQELGDVLYYARRHALPIVAITRNRESRLAHAATVVLCLPAVDEACPLNLAPMTSTTVTVALGDALAAALMRRRGFGPGNFRDFHPGGKLGSLLLTVGEVMHRDDAVPLVPTGTSVRDAVVVMTGKRLGCVGIVDAAGRLVGIFTDGDLRRTLGDGLLERRIEAVMSVEPKTIAPDVLLADAATLMESKAIPSVFVIDQRRAAIGIVHLHDLLRSRLI